MSMAKRVAKWIMLGIIPLLFTVLFVVTLLSFLGVDVGAGVAKVGSRLPVVGKLFPDPNKKDYQQKIDALVNELERNREEISQLKQELEDEQEKSAELESIQREKEEKEQSEAEEQWEESYRQVAKSLEAMSARKAAPIVSQMPLQEGLMMLYSMKKDAQSELLSKLPPEEAGIYTVMLKELLQLSSHMPLAQASAEVATEYEEMMAEADENRDPADWALIFANMPPDNAAAILEFMDEGRALDILRELDVKTRASILASLDAEKAGAFSQRLIEGNNG